MLAFLLPLASKIISDAVAKIPENEELGEKLVEICLVILGKAVKLRPRPIWMINCWKLSPKQLLLETRSDPRLFYKYLYKDSQVRKHVSFGDTRLVDQSSDEPKFGSALNDNTSATVEVYGVDVTEHNWCSNAAIWWCLSVFLHHTLDGLVSQLHMDMHASNLRVKQEVLVAMGSITGLDQADDTLYFP